MNYKVKIRDFAFLAAAAVCCSGCSDWRDGIVPDNNSRATAADDAVAFSTTVSSARQASSTTVSQTTDARTTRADNTIVNKGETMLLPTATSQKKVGIFACYTGQHTWGELVTESQMTEAEIVALSEDEKAERTKKLNAYYSANQMYNVPATVLADGTLSYAPLQFWPNNQLESPSTEHEYMTFWAYYPYNETSALGEYGISMTNDALGEGKGMGRVRFVMHPDAAQQNDFLISAPVTDCNRDKYPLLRTDNAPTYAPKPVQFRLYHMLAQVRFYAFIRGDDKMVYLQSTAGGDSIADSHWFETQALNATIIDAYGNVYTKCYKNGTDDTEGYVMEQTTRKAGLSDEADIEKYGCSDLTKADFVALKLKVPDEAQCVRWDRNTLNIWDVTHSRRRADITYSMQLNNIRTTATFFPKYYYDQGSDAVSIDREEPTALGSATVNHYIMNPYWFTFQNGQRTRLNDNYMFGYYEDTPVAANPKLDATVKMTGYDDIDGMDWRSYRDDPLYYFADHDQKTEIEAISDQTWIDPNDHAKGHKHYNYAPGNILMVVPQTLSDDDVPHVVITAKGKQAKWDADNKKWTTTETELSARVTINMLKMGISWESGYIYCYAFLDDLKPGDDKVRGPESITVLFNKDWLTDQW